MSDVGCAVTNEGLAPVTAVAEIIGGNGQTIRSGSLPLEPGETKSLRLRNYWPQALRCRVTPNTDAALRSRIYIEGTNRESVDGSGAR